MSKTVSAPLENAITLSQSTRMYIKAEIETSRTTFSVLASDYPFEIGPFGDITDSPRPQCMGYSVYQQTSVTFIVDDTGNIICMVQGNSAQHDTGLDTEIDCKPGYWDDNGTEILWYWDISTSKVTRVNIDLSDFSVSNSASWSLTPANWNVTKGSLHAISSTEAVLTYVTSKGGIGVAYYNGSTWLHWSKRFISPNAIVDTGYWTVYTAAVKHNNNVYVYSTDIDLGSVRGVCYDDIFGLWGDTFTALPADLSRFCISNAIATNGYIHLAGQFHRTDDLVNAQIYSLILRSSDGLNFSWDRFTLLSTLGYRFSVCIHPTLDMLYASDRNKVGTSTLSYFFEDPSPTILTLQPPRDIIEFSADGLSSASLAIAAANELFIINPAVNKGNRCKIYIGYQTTGGIEYTLTGTYIINGVDILYADGVRNLQLQLVTEGMWKTQQIAFPFYSEINTRITQRDDCNERDLMYSVTSGEDVTSALAVDLWDSEEYTATGITGFNMNTDYGNSPSFLQASGIYKYGFRTKEISTAIGIAEAPTFSSTSCMVSIFGWTRSDTGRANDTISCRLIYLDNNGEQKEYTGVLQSTYAKFQKYFSGTALGDYPIRYDFTGITVGYKLVAVAIIVENAGASGESCSWFERVEITNLQYSLPGIYGNLTWKQTKPSTYLEDDPTILEMPGMGTPYLMFLTKPYTAFNYQIMAGFEHEAGDHWISTGEGGWGVVGMAADGFNYILARMNLVTTCIELCKVRGGSKVVLSSWNATTEKYRLMMTHRDGEIRVYYTELITPDTWGQEIISYHWDEVTNGAISTSDTEIMHVGVYGEKNTPKFRIPSFCITDSHGIPCIASSDTTVFDDFPSSGVVDIDDILYTYTSKNMVNSMQYGPYACRQISDYTGSLGAEITMFYYNNGPSTSSVIGEFFSTDDGHCFHISSVDWYVAHTNAGVAVPLYNRSRHYLSGLDYNDNFGTSNRMYITGGLHNVARVGSGEPVIHEWGTWCFLAATDRIWVKEVVGSTLDNDATVQDMITVLCDAASVNSHYPGNYVAATGTAVTSPTAIGSKDFMPGGLDVTFTYGNIQNSNDYIAISPVSYSIRAGADPNNIPVLKIGVQNIAGALWVFAQEDTIPVADGYYINTTFQVNDMHKVRIVLYKEFCSIYIDNQTVAIFAFPEVVWPEEAIQIKMYGSSIAYTDLDISELFDWRGSIYIESEMSAASAIASVIQERPIDIYPRSDGSLEFTYDLARDMITYTTEISKRIIRKHRIRISVNQDAGSDAVVYFANVTFASNSDYASIDGFQTRVLKLSGLDTGAKNAATILLRKANQRQYMHSLSLRPDIRIEPGDILQFTYNLSGTNTTIYNEIVVEDIKMTIAEGQYEMVIQGRDNI